MKKFNELLKKYIDAQNLTVYQVSKQTDINRTMLQNIIAGRKKLPQKRLGDLLDCTFFTSEQIKNMCTAYYTDEFDEDKPEFFEFCNYCFSQKFCDDLENTYEAEEFDLKSQNDIEFLKGKDKIIAAVSATIESDNGDIFVSNFDFCQSEINSIIYNACRNKKFKEFYHYTKYTKSEKENANIIFNSIYYATQNCLTYITDSANFNLIFSKFVMFGDVIVLFDDEAENGALIINKDVAQHILMQNEKIKSNAKNDIYIFHNAFEYMQCLDLLSHKKINPTICCIDNHLCSVEFTKEIIDDIATEQIKNSTQVYQQLVSHYDLLLDESTENIDKQIISFYGLENFVTTGRFFDFPKALANTLKQSHRADVLARSLIDSPAKIYITNPEQSDFDKLPFAIETSQNQILISYTSDNNETVPDMGIQIVFENESSDIVDSFTDYIEYLTVSEKTYSPEYSKKLIKGQIEIMQTHEN